MPIAFPPEQIHFRPVTLAIDAMRTRFEIVLPDDGAEGGRLRAAGEAALVEIAEVESFLSAYRPESALARLNATPTGQSFPLDDRFRSLLESAVRFAKDTGGSFDMTVGPLVRLWRQRGEVSAIPGDAEIAEARARVGMHFLLLDAEASTLTITRPDVRLDPGAIGKGYALDRAADVLREAGIRSALLHGGTSSVVAIGGPWRVAIQHPTEPQEHLTIVRLTDHALSVSAVHGRTFWAQGRRFGHVIDPRTGYPVERTLLSATIAPTGTATDALSTAALVLGSDALPGLTNSFPNAGFLVAEEEQSGNNRLRVVTTGTFRRDESGG